MRQSVEKTADLNELFKKTQTKIISLENEIRKVETQNHHQGIGFTNV